MSLELFKVPEQWRTGEETLFQTIFANFVKFVKFDE